jgi:hypothetical protein
VEGRLRKKYRTAERRESISLYTCEIGHLLQTELKSVKMDHLLWVTRSDPSSEFSKTSSRLLLPYFLGSTSYYVIPTYPRGNGPVRLLCARGSCLVFGPRYSTGATPNS